MAGVDQHSGYRGDPWGRLARTSRFLAVTTYGTPADARRQIGVVRAVHRRVVGTAPDGRAYAASDPHLLTWVHVCEIDGFLRSYQRYGAEPLSAADADEYVAQTGRVARALGAVDVPGSVDELRVLLDGVPTRDRGHAGGPGDGALPGRQPAAAGRPASRLPADRRRRRRSAAAVGALAVAAAVAAGHRGDARAGRRRVRDAGDPVGAAGGTRTGVT